MHPNENIIARFYSAFQQKNAAEMNHCYAANIAFSDPVFGLLHGEEVRNMWEMLCKNGKDLQLSFGNIQLLDEEYATCDWVAQYTFSQTGRRVVNNIKAHIRIENGIITEHTDAFDIYKWSRQALGLKGWLFGWTAWFQKKLQQKTRIALNNYIEKK
jgi:ketosteroid isomerase-like protein